MLAGGAIDLRRRRGAAGERLERKRHIARRLESLARILLETMANDAIQSRRDVGSSAGEVGRVLLEDRGHRLGGRVALERTLAGQHFVEHRSQGKQIAPRVGDLSTHLFGRHVADRAHHRARMRDHRRRHGRALCGEGRTDVGVSRRPREAKVQDLHLTVVQHEDVLGLQVAMDDAPCRAPRQDREPPESRTPLPCGS